MDILFEVIGLSDGISKKVVETALKNKIHVITPNTRHSYQNMVIILGKLAEDNLVNLEFEASVAGGIPIIKELLKRL